MTVTVFYHDAKGQLSLLADIGPGDKYNVPLAVVYGEHQALFFRPHVAG